MAKNNSFSQSRRQSWGSSPTAGFLLVVSYLLLAALPVILAFALNPERGISLLREFGKATGLMGFSLLALQVALGSRLKFIERPFGLDVVMKFHKHMAIFAGALLVLHPILLAWASGSARLFFFETSWRVNLGKAALLLLILTILGALLLQRFHIDYQIWRFLHKGAIFVVILGFVHGLVTGSDLQPVGMKIYWWALLIMAVSLFAYRNLIVPLWGRRRFRVTSVTSETYNTWTVALEPESGDGFPYQPGQFMFLKLMRKRLPSEEHPFTISSSPTQEGMITATIKESGDFTSTIGKTKPGDRAFVEAPFGRFSLVHQDAKSFLFIAGGVGITPVMSMLRYLRDTEDKRPVTLIYGNRTEQDIIFHQELRRLPSHMKMVNVLSQARPDWAGPRGYVTREIIREYAGEVIGEADIYLCGPPPMMKKVIKALKSLGVRSRKIHYERFAL